MNGFMRCQYCYATGYKVKPVQREGETISGEISNEKCKICKGKGYITLIS